MLASSQNGLIELLVGFGQVGDILAPTNGLSCPVDESQFLPVEIGDLGKRPCPWRGSGKPPQESQSHFGAGKLLSALPKLGSPVSGNLSLQFFASPNRFWKWIGNGHSDLVAEPTQPLFVSMQCQAAAMGVIVAQELFQKFVGPLKMLLSKPWVFASVKVGNRIVCDASQRFTDMFCDRLVLVVLLHSCRGGIQNLGVIVTKNHLTDHREGQSVGSGLAFDKPKNRGGGVTEIRDQPLT